MHNLCNTIRSIKPVYFVNNRCNNKTYVNITFSILLKYHTRMTQVADPGENNK